MLKIEYLDGGEEQFISIKPLWEKIKEHHKNVSTYFSEYFEQKNFEERRLELLDKSKDSCLKIFLAKDMSLNKFVGYCIATIDRNKVGEIDSIYIEPDYRKNGLGENLMRKALDWMESKQVRSKKMIVAVGNEDVFDFYKQFNFYPRSITLEEKED